MKSKIRFLQIIFSFMCIIFTCLMVTKTIAYFFTQSQSEENIFSTSEWFPAKTTTVMKHQNINGQIQEYINEEKITSYIDENGEHFQLSVTAGQNQFLSFQYKLASEETAEKFDEPAVIVFANQTPLLQLTLTEHDDLWHEAFIDLFKSGLSPGVYDILFLTQNTYDDQFLPNLLVKEVTTTKFLSKPSSVFQFTPDKQVESVQVEYKIWENEKEVEVRQQLVLETKNSSQMYSFIVPENLYGNELSFWSIDLFGNVEQPHYINFNHLGKLNVSNFEQQLFTETERELYLQFQFQNEDETVKFLDARISQNQINSEQDWEQATHLKEKQFQQFVKADVPIIFSKGSIQSNLVFQNLPEGQRYISIKLCNEVLLCEYVMQNQIVESHL